MKELSRWTSKTRKTSQPGKRKERARGGWRAAVKSIDADFRRELPPQIIEELLTEKDRLENPKSLTEIAEEYNIPRGTLNLFYRAHGGRPEEVRNAIVRQYTQRDRPEKNTLAPMMKAVAQRTINSSLHQLEREAFILNARYDELR